MLNRSRAEYLMAESDNRIRKYCDGSIDFFYYMKGKMRDDWLFFEWAAACEVSELQGEYLLFKFLQIDAGLYDR